jgi:oligopeptide transport system substrate-binding protein
VHNGHLLFEKNPYYYAAVTGPDTIRFALMDNDNAILNGFRIGDLDFVESIPVDEVPTLLASGELKVVDYLGTYYVSYNNQKAPFNDARVRKAFSLTIDRNYIVNQITQAGETPAGAFVPLGVADAAGVGSVFRRTGGDYYSLAPDDYRRNVEEAKQLLAEAGYPGGRGFPVLEYLYNTNDAHRAIGEALQNIWGTELGVTVTLGNQDWAVFLDTRKNGEHVIARDGWIGDFNDPITFLDLFTTGGINSPQYRSSRYDALIAEAKATAVQEDRMRLMHQAEDILIGQDHVIAPIYFYTQYYLLNPRVTGMYYTPLGYFFFSSAKVTK